MQPHLRHSFRLTYGRMAPSLVNWYSGPTRNRKFESISPRRPVCLTGAFRGYRHRGPAFAANVSLDETRERDMLASNRLAFAFFL